MGLRGSQGKGERHHGAHTKSERCRVPPGSLPRGPGPKSSPGFEPKRSPKRRRLLPPAGTVPPGRGPKGRDLYRWRLLSRLDARTHTHTHTIECNRTQCKNQIHAHAIRLCKAHTLQYSRRSGGQGGGFGGEAMAEILYRSQCKQQSVLREGFARDQNSCFVQKCP